MMLRKGRDRVQAGFEALKKQHGTFSVTIDCKPGPATILTAEEESRLDQYIVDMSGMGFGLTRDDVMRTAYVCHC